MSDGRDLRAHSCPNCGARLEPAPAAPRIVCRYCGQSFETPQQGPPPPRVILIGPGVPRPRAPPRGGRPAVGTFIGLFTVGIAVSAVLMTRHGTLANLPSMPSIPSLPSLPGQLTSTVSPFLWDTVAGPPIPAPVSGGVEGFVGRIRMRGDDTLWIAAFDGAKLGQAWKAGPYGTYTEGYQSTFTTVVGKQVVSTDYRANLHVFDLASGHETRTLKLTDRAKSMCTAPDGKGRVWIEVSDEKNVVFDVDTGTLTSATRPAWCPDLWAASHDCRGWLKRGAPRLACKGPDASPKVNGFEAENVVEDGDLGVALGKKHPGTAVPMVVGYDPRTKAVRWQQALASGDQAGVGELSTTSIMDALSGGRFSAPYELTSKGWHFTTIDARSGQRLWDVPLQPLIGVDYPEGFALSPARAYVMRTSSLEVYDAKTGTLVGVLGD